MDIADYMRRTLKSWMPHKEDGQPAFIAGEVVKVSTTTSDYNDELVPVVEIIPTDDTETIWRVTGYATVLKRELAELKPRPGDQAGFKYEGIASGVRGDYPRFRVALERSAQPAPEVDWDAIEATLPAADDDDDEQEPF
jgi:hypothetical protein